MTDPLPTAAPIDAVIFDFHGTLFGYRDPLHWIDAARRHLGADRGWPFPATDVAGLATHLDQIWVHAGRIDPASRRDLDHEHHREVFHRAVHLVPDVDPDFIDALYAVMPEQWIPFEDTLPVLEELRENRIRISVLSNIGLDIRPRLHDTGVAGLLDDTVLSYQVGLVKPDPDIFSLALDRLSAPAERTLMVGDSWRDDVGGASLGLRTLILPRTSGPVHGLESVLRLVLNTSPPPTHL